MCACPMNDRDRAFFVLNNGDCFIAMTNWPGLLGVGTMN